MKALVSLQVLPVLLYDWFAFHFLKYILGPYNQLAASGDICSSLGNVFPVPAQKYNYIPKQHIHLTCCKSFRDLLFIPWVKVELKENMTKGLQIVTRKYMVKLLFGPQDSS